MMHLATLLSGGPVREILIGQAAGTLAVLGIIYFCINKFRKSKHFNNIRNQSFGSQLFDCIPLILITIFVAFVLWFLLMFVFAGLAIKFLK